ncbi:hypothetical protein FHG66_13910 [Rubellimicrobium rubrum]|uniref:Uncharacterized protein n=1 Tax=Rubellimicrobium rubrum TaxID=2585369 RepID=A0A5C4MR81_9RHOB|nr:hypothetical protein [Rubellimicrobium rubrum]TNC48444.1 hypothetical protein FHG66_13910 [Rubellimicrobium rubrum]
MRDVLRLSVPLALWLAGFSGVYALQGLTCSRHWPEDLPARPALLVGWALAVLLQAVLLWLISRDPSPSRFVQGTSLALAAVSLLAAAWTSMPVALTSTCL